MALGTLLIALAVHLAKPDELVPVASSVRENFAVTLIGAGLLMLCRSWLLSLSPAAWGATFLFSTGIYLRTQTMDERYFPAPGLSQSGELVLLPDFAWLAFLTWVATCAARSAPATGWRTPLFLGPVSGITLAILRAIWVDLDIGLPPAVVHYGLLFVYAVSVWFCALCLSKVTSFHRDLRWTLTWCLSLGVAVHHFSPDDLTARPVMSMVVIVACTTTGVGVLVATLNLLQAANLEQSGRLHTSLEQAELKLFEEEETRHECRATVAGIASASRLLIHHQAQVQGTQRQSLEDMLEAEMCRLERLLLEPGSTVLGPREPLDLDASLDPLVASHRAQGGRIVHHRGSLQVLPPPDDLARAVNVVLSNARVHAPGATVSISSLSIDGKVSLLISDDGPGISGKALPTVFERHGKGPTSCGQGIGLTYAREVLRQCGGDLEVQPSEKGATFRLVLPT